LTRDDHARYLDFTRQAPLLTIEWHDAETPAVGFLVINSLKGGAAGGGTRMRLFSPPGSLEAVDLAALRDEARFLAKTMEIKFRVCGPPIGGAKSVLHFDPHDPRKRGVLERWFRAIAPYLKLCYGTGGDLGVDEIDEVIPLIRQEVGTTHPQEGVVVGHLGVDDPRAPRVLENLDAGVSLPVELPDLPGAELTVADLITGYGVAEATAAYYAGIGEGLAGRRVLVEGFGNVGGPAAYYFHRLGARVVGVVCKDGADFQWAVDADGLDVLDLLARRRTGGRLPEECPRGERLPDSWWQTPAEVFAPAARSKSVDLATVDRLRAAGVSLLACGANNPFADPVLEDPVVQRRADEAFVVLPDFIANSGMARAFAYLMDPEAELRAEAIFDDARLSIHDAVRRVLAEGGGGPGFLGRALAVYVPAA
jgi:glutamate dehydrogenase/leucine dehydrogenase